MDNCVNSVDSASELEECISKSIEVMAEAKMDLRLWQFGPVEEIEKLSTEDRSLFKEDLTTPVSVLGIRWDRKEDCLIICDEFDAETENPTKRKLLSITQDIYDPIAFLIPALLPAKLMIQEAWSAKSEWDSSLPEKIQKDFQKWYSELKQLSNLKEQNLELSQKRLTIPRLELLACVLGARLANYIREALDVPTIPVYYWTDSSTVIAWIRRNYQWGTFVGNRIREICKLIESYQWYLVPGNLNPADLPSRGCSPRHLIETRWWKGAKWLKDEENNWPKSEQVPNEDLVMSERKKTAISLFTCAKIDQFMNYERISKFCRFVNIVCWIKRFIYKCRNRNYFYPSELSIKEKKEAEKFLWSIQLENFGDVSGPKVKGLAVVKDQNNIIRVKTKLLERDDEFSFKYPILLPSKHHVVNCLIPDCHLKNCHAGLQTVGSILRENYWIISAKRLIRSVKNLLLRTLGRSSLNFEDLSTILCEVEAVMNDRPLTYISEESDKFIPLTPLSFIEDIQVIGIPDLEKINFQKLQKRYRKCQNIKDQLRNRFREEYLANLVQKSREKAQVIQTGDVVLIELDNRKRLNWPIGKVTKLFPSRDGSTRVAEE
ncbi:uncharacterized protein LOC118195758 [Stegodyphus dumicola]|uniref:uncharacterized protein LOC118195758 n=1 Tax=Stegodyphus dumicola TaxID=202533 RepID=UPI0015B2540F|nr:uncharacterized protein LOC118195758 [Stegodyphus dumicola]